jgi:hypothetical protein
MLCSVMQPLTMSAWVGGGGGLGVRWRAKADALRKRAMKKVRMNRGVGRDAGKLYLLTASLIIDGRMNPSNSSFDGGNGRL